jgi:uncharacterized protein YidB (DUF937 family)
MSKLLIDRLEQMFSIMDAKAIYVNSGYRCENNPYGYKTDAHRRGIAADIKVQKKDGSWYNSQDIAEVAERVGFGGIGMMLPISCHVDTRDTEPYDNKHWFGNEYTYGKVLKNDWIKTFQRGTVFAGEKTDCPTQNAKADIKELQQILNNAGAGLVVDGIVGNKTLSAVKKYTVESGDTGNLIQWVQNRLNQLGYNCGVTDGMAGQKTMGAIYDWQKAHNLGVGYLGGGDWDVLLR